MLQSVGPEGVSKYYLTLALQKSGLQQQLCKWTEDRRWRPKLVFGMVRCALRGTQTKL